MSGVYLFDLASRQGDWLSVRASAVAGNLANANTPGYRARDVEPFPAVMDRTAVALTATDPRHLGAQRGPGVSSAEEGVGASWETQVSGNSVSVEQELLKAGDISRQHQLGVSVVRSFHKMLLSTVRTTG